MKYLYNFLIKNINYKLMRSTNDEDLHYFIFCSHLLISLSSSLSKYCPQGSSINAKLSILFVEIIAIHPGNVVKYTDIYTLSENADFIYLKRGLHTYYSTKKGYLQL